MKKLILIAALTLAANSAFAQAANNAPSTEAVKTTDNKAAPKADMAKPAAATAKHNKKHKNAHKADKNEAETPAQTK